MPVSHRVLLAYKSVSDRGISRLNVMKPAVYLHPLNLAAGCHLLHIAPLYGASWALSQPKLALQLPVHPGLSGCLLLSTSLEKGKAGATMTLL